MNRLSIRAAMGIIFALLMSSGALQAQGPDKRCDMTYGDLVSFTATGSGVIRCHFDAKAKDVLYTACQGCSSLAIEAPDGTTAYREHLTQTGRYTALLSYSFPSEDQCFSYTFSLESSCVSTSGGRCVLTRRSARGGEEWCPVVQVTREEGTGQVTFTLDLAFDTNSPGLFVFPRSLVRSVSYMAFLSCFQLERNHPPLDLINSMGLPVCRLMTGQWQTP